MKSREPCLLQPTLMWQKLHPGSSRLTFTHGGMWMWLEVKLLVGRATLTVNPLSELERGGTKGQYTRVCNQLSERSLGSHLTWLSPEFICWEMNIFLNAILVASTIEKHDVLTHGTWQSLIVKLQLGGWATPDLDSLIARTFTFSWDLQYSPEPATSTWEAIEE